MENKTEYMDHNFEGGLCLERIKSKIAWDMPKMHSHNYHEIYFLVSGKRQYFVGHKIYDVNQGDIVIIPQNELHRTSGGVAGYERFVLHFSDELADEFKRAVGNDKFSILLNMGCVSLSNKGIEKARTLLEEIEQEKIKGDCFSELLCMKALYELFAVILRYGSQKKQQDDTKADRIETVVRYISENFSNPITLSDVSKMAYMEETYFSKRFKQITGFGFNEYLTHIRIKMAEELLKNSDLSIGEISEQCGFSGGNYFGDAFKKIKGISPSVYRKNIREASKKRL